MKDKAINYLMKNPLLHMGIIEPINRGTAEILYAGTDGVLIKEQKSNAYMISVNNLEKGQELIEGIAECNIITAHQRYMVEYIADKFGLTCKLECVQAVYDNKSKLNVKEDLEIRKLGQNQTEVILEHYDKLPKNEIEELLSNGNLFGGFKDGKLIGFIGNHLEGSIGLLEVLQEYRRLGYGAALVSFMVNKMLDEGLIPFAQSEVDNKKSITLQEKLGFKISQDRLYWLF